MANISASMVKSLREMTGAGMMDCKKALTATDGDMDKAVEFLREKGLAAAAKKAARIAAEGIVATLVKGSKGVIVEVNSETDFVAKNAVFQEFVGQVAEQCFASENTEAADLLQETWLADPTLTVEQAVSSKVAIIGEKLSIRRFAALTAENGTVVSYIHAGGRIGVLVQAECGNVTAEVEEALHNVAMQVAALRPQYVNRDEIPAEFIAHEKEILLAQIMNDPKESQKPQKVIDGMIMGRVNKELKEFCLVDQVYVKAEDGKQTVGQYLAQVAKSAGTSLAVKKFVRFETGEGMEKKNEDFAAEVAKQMAQ